MDAKAIVAQFLRGDMGIIEFRRLYDGGDEINDFLQGIIDRMRETRAEVKRITYHMEGVNAELTTGKTVDYLLKPNTYPGRRYGNPYESVRKLLNFELNMITHNVRTASGALNFYSEVYDIYTQVDPDIPRTEKYSDAFDFVLDVIPEYLQGGESEMYIQQHIIPQFPETMTKTARKRAIRAKIKEEFRSDKGYPAWSQHSEWPMGKDGRPAVYAGRKKKGELVQFFFRDESDGGNMITVEQYY